MAAPALRIPVGLDMAGFRQSIDQAKSLTSTATSFMLKEFAKTQLTLAVNSSQFKPAVQASAKFLGDQFNSVKPVIQNVTRDAVRESTAASLKIADAFAKPAITGSFQAFSAVAVPAAQGFSSALLPIAARATMVAGSVLLMADAIGAARAQMAAMVAIADKSSTMTVSPQFLQLFEGEARKLKVTTDELDNALSNAFRATKELAPIDVSKWEAAGERITNVELALRVYNAQLEKASGIRLDGLVLFRDADTQEGKVRAVLEAMRQLEQSGQSLAALDIGERMFGSEFVDRIRQGKTSADSMLATMDQLSKSGDGIFSSEIVKRAKDIDDQLKLAEERLSRAMKPTWDDLASVIMTIKSTWADIVDLIAKAIEMLNSLPGLQGVFAEEMRKAGMPAATTSEGAPAADTAQPTRVTVYAKPTRGTGAAPVLRDKPAAPGSTERNRFDGAAGSIEKRIAGLEAEAAAINLGTAARERARIAAELETVAQQANAAAGLGANVVTAEQRAQIDLLADAYGRVAERIEQSRSPLATYTREAADLSKQLNYAAASNLESMTDSLSGVVTGTKSVSDAFRSMANSIISDLARIAIRKTITGPLSAGLGAIFGFADGGMVPAFADGGVIRGPGGPRSDSIVARVSAGEYIVNAEATSRHLQLLEAINSGRLPTFADGGYVAPAVPMIRGGGDAAVNVTFAPQVDARGADVAAVTRLEQALARQQREFEGRVRQIVADRPNKRW